jgi:hypothetical protein
MTVKFLPLLKKRSFFSAYHHEQNKLLGKKLQNNAQNENYSNFLPKCQGRLSMEPLWYKIGENRRDKKISHSGNFNTERMLKEERSEAALMNVQFS